MADLLHPDETQQDEIPETPIDPGDFELAWSAENSMQAGLLADACEEAGIPCILQSPRSGPVGTISSPVESFNLLVPKKDLDRARALIAERRAALDADPEGAQRAAEEEEAAGEIKS